MATSPQADTSAHASLAGALSTAHTSASAARNRACRTQATRSSSPLMCMSSP